MPFEYLDNIATADVAFRARGKTLEEMFAAAADATMNVMIENLAAIRPKEDRSLSIESEQLDLLLYKFLQEIIFLKDAQKLLLRVKHITLIEEHKRVILKVELAGEKIAPRRHKLKVDIKAITLHLLKVIQNQGQWEGTVVADI